MPGRPKMKARREELARERDARQRVSNRAATAFLERRRSPLEEERKANVRKDMRYIASYYFKGTDGRPYRLQEYHLEILQAMFQGGYLIVNVPTDHMKSSLGCFLFPLLSLMENPDETHIICGANLNDSKRRVQAIERELESNQLLTEDYPWVGKPQERQDRIWTATQFNVQGRTVNKPNPSVLASAIGANDLKGRRGKLVMDDVEGEDARWSPTKREQLYSWLKLEAWRCYENQNESPRPLLCLLGTPFDVDSIYFRMEQQDWKVIRYPCYLDGGLMKDDPEIDCHGHPIQGMRKYLWPEQSQKVEKARKDLGSLAFSIAYLMDPTGGDPTRLSATELRERISGAREIDADQFAGFVTLDPAAGGTGRRVDYAGIAAVKINWPAGAPLPRVDLLEVHDFRQGLFEQVHFCAQLSQQYGFPVLIESNSQQGGVYQTTFGHLHPEVKLLRHYTSQSNKFGDAMGPTVIRRLAVDSMLYVPQGARDSDAFQAFIQELRDLVPPYNQHNHIAMAVWFAVRYVYERVRHSRAPSISLTYGKDPMTQARDIWGYQDDPSLHPLERAYRAIGYDRTARQGGPPVIGYTAWGQQQQMPWDRALEQEEERFLNAARGRKAV